jgi:hypothetical protein
LTAKLYGSAIKPKESEVKVVLGLLLAAFAGVAGATNCTTLAEKKLKFFGDDTGIITWQGSRVDSPRDANTQRIGVSVLFQDGDEYAGANGTCTGIEGKLTGQVKNLSFDFENETANPVHIGAGAPRYTVELDSTGGNVTDTYAYLSAFYCADVLPEDTRWSRADWTGRTLAGCEIFVGSETFTSDGVNSAWKLLATAHPTWAVVQAYFVMDEEGTAFVDRLAFQNEMFVSPTVIQKCTSEASC